MEYIKQNFSIKDLENLTGIKAHTIRIWEKRYNILSPTRTSTNIRTYNSCDLQKILNISFLNENGYKISRISKLSEEDINKMVRNISASASEKHRSINALKMAMINFDHDLFDQTYQNLRKNKSFREIFDQVFIPLLDEIGLLWQTDSIKPVHEHYIVELIKQKIYLNSSYLKEKNKLSQEILYVLFLPNNEIHDIGLLYLNYELNYHNLRTIYLGPSLPLSDMQYLMDLSENIVFLTYCTTSPQDVQGFISEFQANLSTDKTRQLFIFGRKISDFGQIPLPENIKIFHAITDFIKTLKPF